MDALKFIVKLLIAFAIVFIVIPFLALIFWAFWDFSWAFVAAVVVTLLMTGLFILIVKVL